MLVRLLNYIFKDKQKVGRGEGKWLQYYTTEVNTNYGMTAWFFP